MSIVHISQFDPLRSAGGVATFARDLERVFPGIKFLYHGPAEEPWHMAGIINRSFLNEGKISEEDIVIADGYYGAELAGKVKRLIVVCHSTYAGWLRDNLMYPYDQLNLSCVWLTRAARAQEPVYREADTVVSVCTSASEELWDFYKVESKTIFNGVNPSLFNVLESDTVVEVAGNDINKGMDIISDLKTKAELSIFNLGYDGSIGERWAKHGIAVMPSRHEGGSYAQLEAMASGLDIVASYAGFFKHDVPRNLFYGTDDLYWRTFADMIHYTLDDRASAYGGSRGGALREWVKSNATLDIFKKKWRGLVND